MLYIGNYILYFILHITYYILYIIYCISYIILYIIYYNIYLYLYTLGLSYLAATLLTKALAAGRPCTVMPTTVRLAPAGGVSLARSSSGLRGCIEGIPVLS